MCVRNSTRRRITKLSFRDLVKRHISSHQQNTAGSGKSAAQGLQHRVSQACKACASAKLKCEEKKPCGRCRSKGISCEYSLPESLHGFESPSSYLLGTFLTLPYSRYRHVLKRFQENHTTPESYGSEVVNMRQDDTCYQPPTRVSTATPTTQLSLPETSAQIQSMEVTNQGHCSTFTNDGCNMGAMELTENYFPNFIQDMIMPPPDEQFPCMDNSGYLYPPQNPRGFMDYGRETNLELNDRDFGHLHDFKQENAVIIDRLTNGASAEQMEEKNPEPRNLAIGAEAFKKSSITDWTPGQHNSSYEEQGNLSLSTDAFIQATRMVSGRILVTQRLALSSRDKILAMVLDTCVPVNRPRTVESFPSTEILDGLVQCFCYFHSQQTDTWIHIPSLNPDTIMTELLGMIIAAGAVRTPIIAVQKLGFALMESVRNSFFRRVSGIYLQQSTPNPNAFRIETENPVHVV